MFTELQLQPLAAALASAAERNKFLSTPDVIAAARDEIGREVWGFGKNQYWSEDEFLPFDDSVARADAILGLERAASNIEESASLLDALEGSVTSLLSSIYFGFPMYKKSLRGDAVMFGGGARPQDVHRLKEVRRAANVMNELRRDFPESRQRKFENRQVPKRGGRAYINDIVSPPVNAADLFVSESLYFAAALRGAAAVCRRQQGGQTKRGPLLLARCALAWKSATGRLPPQTLKPVRVNKKRETMRPASQFYDEILRLVDLAGGAIDGFSSDTYILVMKTVATDVGESRARWNFDIELPKKKKKARQGAKDPNVAPSS